MELLICLLPSIVHIQCRRTDLPQRQPISLLQVGCLARNSAQMTIWEHQILMLEIHQAKTRNSGNPPINFIHHWGTGTHLHCHHFQVLPSSTTLPHSAWHQAYNQAVGQPNDNRVMGHRGKHVPSPEVVMLDHKCSPLSNSQDKSHNLQAHLECLQHCLEIIQSLGRHLPAILQQDNFLAHLGDY